MHIPVNSFPPEVLSRILEHRDCEQDLVSATHVCQYWRSALTSSPSLWSNFRFWSSRNADRTVAYLHRSKSVTIDLEINLRSSEELEVLRHFVPHMSRARSFIIRGPLGVDAAFSLLLCKPVPSLDRLEVNGREGFVSCLGNFLGQQAPSLRSAVFTGIFPTLESPLPLPNLTELSLHLPPGTGPFRMSLVSQFLPGCPRLQKFSIAISGEILQDIGPDPVISSESLVELDYACVTPDRILPYLDLPHLKRLRVSSYLPPGQMRGVADFLPHGGSILAGVTSMSYYSNFRSERAELSGEDIHASFDGIRLFSDEESIPFRQIEDLNVDAYEAGDFPIRFFKNLRTLRMVPGHPNFTRGFLQLLSPRAEVPCGYLREIEYTCRSSPSIYIEPLISLLAERERAGHRVELVRTLSGQELDEDLGDRLRALVGELQVTISEGRA